MVDFHLSPREYIPNWDFQYNSISWITRDNLLSSYEANFYFKIFSIVMAWDIWSTVCNLITNTPFSLHSSLNLILIFQVRQLLLHIPFWISRYVWPTKYHHVIVGTFIHTQIVFSYSIDYFLYYSFVDSSRITILNVCIYWIIWIAGNPPLNDGFD